LAVVAMAYSIGPISGCHINPAITIAMFALNKISLKDTVCYIVSQCLGAILGAAVLYSIALGKADYSINVNGLGQNGFGTGYIDEYSVASAFIAEVVFTAIFLVVIFGVTSFENSAFAGLAIGLTLVLIHIVGIPVTGVSVNPARSIGPALFVGGKALHELWLFVAGPIVGGLTGAVIWRIIGKK